LEESKKFPPRMSPEIFGLFIVSNQKLLLGKLRSLAGTFD
jgi:hypothetical protein